MSDDRQLFLEGLATLQDHAAAQLQLGRELARLAHVAPARMSLETLTAAEPIRTLAELGNARSVGIMNWSTVEVEIGYAGRSATAGNGIPVPPRSWLLLPLEVNMLDLGAAQTDLQVVGEARVAVIRFEHALPLMAGTLGGEALPLGDSVFASTRIVSPAGGATLVEIRPPVGVYRVRIQAATSDNLSWPLELRSDTTALGTLSTWGDSIPPATVIERLTIPAPSLKVVAAGAGTGSTITTVISATRIA